MVKRRSPVLVLSLLWLVAVNLRTGFIGLGPVLPRLTIDLQLTHTEASILVAVPTAMMGLAAAPGGRLADRWGAARAIALGLAIVAIAGAARAGATSFPPLVVVTVLFGIGIGLSQPALPRIARLWFPGRLGASTGIYASGFVCGAIISASLTGPVLFRFLGDQNWGGPLALWGALALVTFVAWTIAMQPWQSDPATGAAAATPASVEGAEWSAWRDRGVWWVALLFAAQGIAYYLLIAWMPAVYEDLGLGAGQIAALYATFNAATLPAIVGFPALSDRLNARRPAALIASLLFVGGAIGLALAPLADPWRWLWAATLGAGVAGLFAMTLVLPAEIAPRGQTGAVAGMVLAVGYTGSALGPVIAGVVRDVTGSFASALAMMPLLGLGMIVLSLLVPDLLKTRHH